MDELKTKIKTLSSGLSMLNSNNRVQDLQNKLNLLQAALIEFLKMKLDEYKRTGQNSKQELADMKSMLGAFNDIFYKLSSQIIDVNSSKNTTGKIQGEKPV